MDVDCLRFGFECVVKDTDWESLALEIEQVARRQRCPRCKRGIQGGELGHGLSRDAARPQPLPSLEKSFRSHTSRWKRMSQIAVEKKVLNENQKIAAELREKFRAAQDSGGEHHQLAGLGQDHAAGAHSGADGQKQARGAADRRSANGKRRHAAGAMGLSGEADHHRRHLPSGREDDRAAPGGVAAGELRRADHRERGQPGMSDQLRSGRAL